MLFDDDRGNITTLSALALVPIILSAGVAIDYASVVRERTVLQSALDAGVLAAASSSDFGLDAATSAAKEAYNRNLRASGCTDSPAVSISDQSVTAAATCIVDTALLKIAGLQNVTIVATSTAIRPSGSAACLITLHGSDKETVMVNSDSAILAPDCDVQINSSNAQALRGNSNGDITARRICLNGDWVADNSSNFSPSPEDCRPVSDPLAALPPPPEASGSCTATDLKVVGKKTLNPGVYCKKLEIDSGAEVTLNPGIYVVRDGEFIVNSLSRMRGDGVMIFLTGSNNARFNINSGSHIEIRAPRTGTYAGIAIYQERGSKADFSILNSDSTSFIEGVIYLPSTPLHLNSYGGLSPSAPWTMVISSKIEVNSHSVLRLNADYKASSVPLPASIRAAQRAGNVRLVN